MRPPTQSLSYMFRKEAFQINRLNDTFQLKFSVRSARNCHTVQRLGLFSGHRPKCSGKDRKKLSHFGQNVWKYRLKNIVTASFHTTLRQMTEMSQWRTSTYQAVQQSARRKVDYTHSTPTTGWLLGSKAESECSVRSWDRIWGNPTGPQELDFAIYKKSDCHRFFISDSSLVIVRPNLNKASRSDSRLLKTRKRASPSNDVDPRVTLSNRKIPSTSSRTLPSCATLSKCAHGQADFHIFALYEL